MLERGFVIVFVFLLMISFSIVVYAQEEGEAVGDVETGGTDEKVVGEVNNGKGEATNGANDALAGLDKEFSNAELGTGAGITPDSGFYFVEDAILSKFRDDLDNREKKVAEIKAMVESGNIDAARTALERYKRYADELEREINPEKREEARRSAAAIRNTLREIEDQIPKDAREEFVDDIIEKEGKIVTAVEIAGKIKELCEQLSKLDPNEYARVCKTGEDAPQWQRKLNKELTKEQEQEARAFFNVLSQCFKTSGRECRCEEINVKPFADRCSIVAPLALQCDEGDKNSCEAMDDATEGMEDLLPEYLQDVMREVEERFGEAQMDLHMPQECREANAKTPKECMKIMIRTNAPEECVEELEKRNVQNEREARQICEEIMFKLNAPEECISAGLKDPKECGRLMFKQNAPEECINAGLTGESRTDPKKCREIMEGLGKGPDGPGGFGGGNCREIQDSQERLKCYDEASKGVGGHYENKGPSGGWPPQCEEKGATTRESCERVMREWGEKQRSEFESKEGERFREEFGQREGEFEHPEGEFGIPKECEGLSPEECRSKFEGQQPPAGFVPPEGIPPEGQPPATTEHTEPTLTPTPAPEPVPSPTDSGITGGVIFDFEGNGFLSYYFK